MANDPAATKLSEVAQEIIYLEYEAHEKQNAIDDLEGLNDGTAATGEKIVELAEAGEEIMEDMGSFVTDCIAQAAELETAYAQEAAAPKN